MDGVKRSWLADAALQNEDTSPSSLDHMQWMVDGCPSFSQDFEARIDNGSTHEEYERIARLTL